MQGEIFLGPQAAPEAEYVYGFRDRVALSTDALRSLLTTQIAARGSAQGSGPAPTL